MRRFFAHYNATLMPPLTDPVLNVAISYFQNAPHKMVQQNGLFIQVIRQGIDGGERLRKKTLELYNVYLNLEKVAAYTLQHTFGNFSGEPDWSDIHLANFLLFSERKNGKALMLSQHTLDGMLTPDPAEPVWHRIYVYQGQKNLNVGEYNLSELFMYEFRLFHGPYKNVEQTVGLHSLLNVMRLDDMHLKLHSATKERYCSEKLVSIEYQMALNAIFENILQDTPQRERLHLTEAHYLDILAAFGLSVADKTHQAQTLLCLAALFAKYSSSAIFGTEEESPIILRSYAWALMEKAHEVDSTFFESREQYGDWENRLLGLKGAYTCTAVIYDMMTLHIRFRSPDVLAAIMPPAWN